MLSIQFSRRFDKHALYHTAVLSPIEFAAIIEMSMALSLRLIRWMRLILGSNSNDISLAFYQGSLPLFL